MNLHTYYISRCILTKHLCIYYIYSWSASLPAQRTQIYMEFSNIEYIECIYTSIYVSYNICTLCIHIRIYNIYNLVQVIDLCLPKENIYGI